MWHHNLVDLINLFTLFHYCFRVNWCLATLIDVPWIRREFQELKTFQPIKRKDWWCLDKNIIVQKSFLRTAFDSWCWKLPDASLQNFASSSSHGQLASQTFRINKRKKASVDSSIPNIVQYKTKSKIMGSNPGKAISSYFETRSLKIGCLVIFEN